MPSLSREQFVEQVLQQQGAVIVANGTTHDPIDPPDPIEWTAIGRPEPAPAVDAGDGEA